MDGGRVVFVSYWQRLAPCCSNAFEIRGISHLESVSISRAARTNIDQNVKWAYLSRIEVSACQPFPELRVPAPHIRVAQKAPNQDKFLGNLFHLRGYHAISHPSLAGSLNMEKGGKTQKSGFQMETAGPGLEVHKDVLSGYGTTPSLPLTKIRRHK